MSLDPIGGPLRGQDGRYLRDFEPVLLFTRPTGATEQDGELTMFVFEMIGAVFFMLFFGAMVTNKHSISR
jgi:hypothetical protein